MAQKWASRTKTRAHAHGWGDDSALDHIWIIPITRHVEEWIDYLIYLPFVVFWRKYINSPKGEEVPYDLFLDTKYYSAISEIFDNWPIFLALKSAKAQHSSKMLLVLA